MATSHYRKLAGTFSYRSLKSGEHAMGHRIGTAEDGRPIYQRVDGWVPVQPFEEVEDGWAPVEITTVYIDADPASLGARTTGSDLEVYAHNLAEHLAARFDRTVNVVPVLGGERAGMVCPSDLEIDAYVRDLRAGDGWVKLL